MTFLGSGDAFGSGGADERLPPRRDLRPPLPDRLRRSAADGDAQPRRRPKRHRGDPRLHLHGDHFGGIPFLILDAQFVNERTVPLTIAGLGHLEALGAHDGGPASRLVRFTVGFELDLLEPEPGGRAALGSIAVTPYLVSHPPARRRSRCGSSATAR